MAGTAAKIIISERQQIVLKEFSKSRTVGKSVSQRSTIILLGFQGLFNEEIALRVGLNRQQVGISGVGILRKSVLSTGESPVPACSAARRG